MSQSVESVGAAPLGNAADRTAHPAFSRRVLRRIISGGSGTGLAAKIGKWAGRRIGWPLSFGPKVIIDAPAEYMQSHMLWYGAYEPEVAEALLSVTKHGGLFLEPGGYRG